MLESDNIIHLTVDMFDCMYNCTIKLGSSFLYLNNVTVAILYMIIESDCYRIWYTQIDTFIYKYCQYYVP